MTTTRRPRCAVSLAVACAALLAGVPAHAMYKVVDPDGRVTYTDTPPAPSKGTRIIELGAHANVIAETALPLELRQAAQRFPVTLYTVSPCEPCDQARTLLRQRGVPFSEKLVLTADDAEALSRLSAGREAPTLTVGQQVLRGFAAGTWAGYLDAAGYPRESRLPQSYQYPAATPLTTARATSTPLPVPLPSAPSRAAEDAGAVATPTPGNGIRF
jgi:glutaredoxin